MDAVWGLQVEAIIIKKQQMLVFLQVNPAKYYRLVITYLISVWLRSAFLEQTYLLGEQ